MQDSKRVIVLEHIKSDNIEQAIIILKENTKSKYSSIIKEAEHIVNSYAQTLDCMGAKKPIVVVKKNSAALLWMSMAAVFGLIGMAILILQFI